MRFSYNHLIRCITYSFLNIRWVEKTTPGCKSSFDKPWRTATHYSLPEAGNTAWSVVLVYFFKDNESLPPPTHCRVKPVTHLFAGYMSCAKSVLFLKHVQYLEAPKQFFAEVGATSQPVPFFSHAWPTVAIFRTSCLLRWKEQTGLKTLVARLTLWCEVHVIASTPHLPLQFALNPNLAKPRVYYWS